MRGYNYPLGKLIQKGLRTDRSNQRNSDGLIECFNLKPHISGLIAYEELSSLFTDLEFIWPYPQAIMTSKFRWMLTVDKIYSADTDWNVILAQNSEPGDLWDVADFGDYLLFCNGTRLVERSSAGVFSSNTSLSTVPLALSICNFNGQLIAGNIKSEWYDCDESFVAWGRIGAIDMTPDGSNVAGYRPMPWKGGVRKVAKLGNAVIVYCENGVGLLSPFNQTFGLQELLSVGVPCKGAIGGDELSQVFVDNDNYLWEIGADLKAKRLGYQEFMESLNSDSIVVSLQPKSREFYISDGVHSYLLTPFGLCKVYQRPSSVVSDGVINYGTFDTTVEDEDLEARLTTDKLDFGVKGMKTVEGVEFGMEIDPYAKAYGSIDYCYDGSGVFDRSDWLLLNPEGQCAPMVTAPEVRICFKVDDFAEVKVDSANVGIKFPDRRFRRGAYAIETNARSGE